MKKNKSSTVANRRKTAGTKRLLPKPFPIVGFGASAGGIEAFIEVLQHLHEGLGMAYVFILHLAPNHKSALAQIIRSKTKMPVQTVKNGMEVRANNVYVIPPDTFMSLVDGHLKLAPRSITTKGNFAIDYFLTGLASIYKNNAIGVILSGTATDGTLGLKAIKAEGGITFAQNDTAKFPGMPMNAVESGYVDFVLPPEGIANELSRLVEAPYTNLSFKKIDAHQGKEVRNNNEELKKILAIVKNKSGIDFFQHYKHASIYRRLMRRMTLNNANTLEEYCSMLRTSPTEADALFKDFLINVTQFFRDPDFYKRLTKQIFPEWIKQKVSVDPIRIWVAGCSTGEEAYSIAICWLEFLGKKAVAVPIQIFASDLDEDAIERARSGIYAISALQGVSLNNLNKYFIKINGHYQIIKAIREICVFAKHDLLKDPPFSRINLISCQNVLIYLNTTPQTKILHTFHYALKQDGYLFLGKSEAIGASTDLFEPLDKKIKLYARKPTNSPQLDFTISKTEKASAEEYLVVAEHSHLEKDITKFMLSQFVYPSVVVNKSLMIIQFFGVTSAYLEPLTGKASLNVLKMIREDLVLDLGMLLQQARKSGKVASKEGIRIYDKKTVKQVTIEVVPRQNAGSIFFIVVFKNGPDIVPVSSKRFKNRNDHNEKTIVKLEEELVQSRVLIRSTNEEYETTYEELQANNEEILSSNEELQSVNEELETSKEELQSAVEELTTTNDELRKRNIELSESQSELKKVNEQLEQFAFISSHDLQEPLRKIITFSDRLSDPKASLNDFAKLYASKINTSASRMSELIKGLLTYSLLRKNNRINTNKVNLNDTVRNVVSDLEVVIENKHAIVSYSALPVIYGDDVLINQLFQNLIANSLKFSKGSPRIIVSARTASARDFSKHTELKKDKKYISVTVKDNGIGFDEKYAEKIFVLFQRLDYQRTANGTGVGLTISKQIVEDHGGYIFATGKINVGATFTIYFQSI